MVKTVIIPEQSSYNLTIPQQYIGKKIEILLYSLDELVGEDNNPESKQKPNIADFCGIFSEESYQALKAQTEQARQEWNRNI